MAKVPLKVAVLVTVASLGLSACGASVQKTLKGAIASVGAQQYLQVHVTASVSGVGATAAQAVKDQKVLSLLSYNVDEQSATGSSIATSAGKVNEEVSIDVGSTTLVDLIEVGNNLYVKVDFTPVSALPGVGATSAELSSLQVLFGARWFELPSTLLSAYLPDKAKVDSQSAHQHALEEQVVDALSTLIERTRSTTVPGGYSQTGSLQSVADVLAPVLAKFSRSSSTVPHKVPGTYHVALSLSGSTATGAQVGITAPSATSGDMTLALKVALAHQSRSITAPTQATVITRQLLAGLSGHAATSAL